MQHNVRVAVIGKGEYLSRLIREILDQKVIPAGNMFLSAEDQAAREAAGDYPVVFCEDNATAVVMSEIVLLCAPKRDMPSELSPIAKCTGSRVLVTVCDSEDVNLDYVRERVVAGTELIAATLHEDENGQLSASFEIERGGRAFLHQPCRDMVNTLCG